MTRRRRLLIAACAVGLAVSGCGSDDDAGTDTAAPTTGAGTASTAPVPEPTTSTTTLATATATSTEGAPARTTVEPAPEPPADLPTLLADRGVGSLTLRPVEEDGSHPTLGWEAIDGATVYWLVILDDAGRPYWAWTGSDTSVRVGGGDQADGNQTAALHEEMTWSVSAFDADGGLIAFSEPDNLAP